MVGSGMGLSVSFHPCASRNLTTSSFMVMGMSALVRTRSGRIDVDLFKAINDTHGHPVGDEVLRQIAARMAGRLRRHDVLGRYGGEEFCVVAPDTDIEGALLLAESLRELIASTPLVTESGEISVSISIGVSCFPSDGGRELKAVLTEADDALYAAKQSGRNRVAHLGALPAGELAPA